MRAAIAGAGIAGLAAGIALRQAGCEVEIFERSTELREIAEFLGTTAVSSQLVTLLTANASHYEWVAATVDANNAASYELATGESVMGDRRIQWD